MLLTKLYNTIDKILDRWSLYGSPYPYNLGYFDGTYIEFDCHNLFKAIAWTDGDIANNYTVGNFAHYNAASGVRDWTTREFLDHCSDVSYDMSHIMPGEYLWMEGHGGMYYGNGLVCECTPIWENGVFLTNISPDGTRSYKSEVWGKWVAHGKMMFVTYPKVGDIIKIKDGAHPYGQSGFFLDEVYHVPHTIIEIDDRRCVVRNEKYGDEAVDILDMEEWVEPPVEEMPNPYPPEDPIEEEPIEPPVVEPRPTPTDPNNYEDIQMSIWTKEFWIDCLERAIATAVEVALTYITLGMTLTDINWAEVGSAAAVGFGYTVLKCLGVATLKKK